jgi:hypothetical protein
MSPSSSHRSASTSGTAAAASTRAAPTVVSTSGIDASAAQKALPSTITATPDPLDHNIIRFGPA